MGSCLFAGVPPLSPSEGRVLGDEERAAQVRCVGEGGASEEAGESRGDEEEQGGVRVSHAHVVGAGKEEPVFAALDGHLRCLFLPPDQGQGRGL